MAHRIRNDDIVVSYVTLRRVLGVLGVSLPLVLAFWGVAETRTWDVLPSISDYSSLRARDALVGILFAIACFLFAYRGYDRRDDIAGDLGSVFALGVALFSNRGGPLEGAIHFASAAALFLVLAYFSFFLFTRSNGSVTPMKEVRNRVYRGCAVTMVACIVLIGIYSVFLRESWLSFLRPVFWLEALALWAFGASWFLKGETILQDRGT
jgi:hypothetical protein